MPRKRHCDCRPLGDIILEAPLGWPAPVTALIGRSMGVSRATTFRDESSRAAGSDFGVLDRSAYEVARKLPRRAPSLGLAPKGDAYCPPTSNFWMR
jgi:hypothetical protein